MGWATGWVRACGSASVEMPVKDSILQEQEQSILIFRKTSKCIKRLAWMSFSAKCSIQEVETGTGCKGEI